MKYIATICVILLLGQAIRAPARPQCAFQPLAQLKEASLISCSLDGQFVAAIGPRAALVYYGESLEIWRIGGNGELTQLVFRGPAKAAYRGCGCWCDDGFMYSYYDISKESDINSVAPIRGAIWLPTTGVSQDYLPATGDYLLWSARAGRLCAIGTQADDVRKAKLQGLESTTGKRFDNILDSVLIESYAYPATKAVSAVRSSLSVPRFNADADTVPVLLSGSGRTLFYESQVAAWDDNGSQLSALSASDLVSGGTRQVTPTSETDVLAVRGLRLYDPGNAAAIRGGTQMACALNAYQANLAYRFQYYDEYGKLLRDLRMGTHDIWRAGIPEGGSLVTFTQDGDAIIQVRGDLWMIECAHSVQEPQADRPQDRWLYRMGKVKAHLMLRNLVVKDVMGWSGPNRLLVRAEPYTKGDDSAANMQWGFLHIH